MTRAGTAAAFAAAVARDDSHGYDQAGRWGPDYDCSSLVISAWRHAGVPLSCTYTGNMYADFTARGFTDVTGLVDLATGRGLIAGDVLLNHREHTALFIGEGNIVQAGGNERGGVTGGRSGDQTGREIRVMPYYSHPWDCVLRYAGPEEDAPSGPQAPGGETFHTVAAGETLWGIAERYYGSGALWTRLRDANGLTSSVIYPGQVLRIEMNDNIVMSTDNDARATCTGELPVLRPGAKGMETYTLQLLLCDNGFPLPLRGPDGEFGPETLAALRGFQQAEAVTGEDGFCGPLTWTALLRG